MPIKISGHLGLNLASDMIPVKNCPILTRISIINKHTSSDMKSIFLILDSSARPAAPVEFVDIELKGSLHCV